MTRFGGVDYGRALAGARAYCVLGVAPVMSWPFMPRAPWNLQEKLSAPEAGNVTSTWTLPLGGTSLSMPSAGMLMLWEHAPLALDDQRQPLPGLASQERRREVVVIGLQLELRAVPDILGAVVRIGHAAQGDGYPFASAAAFTGAGSVPRRDRQHSDLARGVADGNRRGHRAAGQVHHRDVVRGLVGHVRRAAVGARHAPVRGFAHGHGTGHRVAHGVKE